VRLPAVARAAGTLALGGVLTALLAVAALAAPGPATVELEALTSTELQQRIAAGTRTVLLPIGGTEQNGAHMALGKHNVRARLLAERIALALGDAVVAPVLAYVPEGDIDPPTGHMRWAGTISIPVAAFEATLEGAARSLHRHGLCHIVLLGDHGGYRASLDRVAARVNRAWAAQGTCRVHALPEYYRASSTDYARALADSGHAAAEIGTHAGLADTSLMLALDPSLVRADAMAARAAPGVAGNPARATAELGRPGVEHIVQVTVAAIRAATKAGP
jgi:creatinine amidohydrolase/Fe(II)-dependent formamide hydrolase-like protein